MNAIMEFKKINKEEMLGAAVSGITENIIKDHFDAWTKAMESFTVEQFSMIISQMILSGDFVTNIRDSFGTERMSPQEGEITFISWQKVTYVPFYQKEILEKRVQVLEDSLSEVVRKLRYIFSPEKPCATLFIMMQMSDICKNLADILYPEKGNEDEN
jgi:hypothetical protein